VLELTERQHIVSLKKLRADLPPFIDLAFVWRWMILVVIFVLSLFGELPV